MRTGIGWVQTAKGRRLRRSAAKLGREAGLPLPARVPALAVLLQVGAPQSQRRRAQGVSQSRASQAASSQPASTGVVCQSATQALAMCSAGLCWADGSFAHNLCAEDEASAKWRWWWLRRAEQFHRGRCTVPKRPPICTSAAQQGYARSASRTRLVMRPRAKKRPDSVQGATGAGRMRRWLGKVVGHFPGDLAGIPAVPATT